VAEEEEEVAVVVVVATLLLPDDAANGVDDDDDDPDNAVAAADSVIQAGTVLIRAITAVCVAACLCTFTPIASYSARRVPSASV
jgi:hypothetical protein